MLPLIKPGAALIISPSPVSLSLPLCCFPLNGFYLDTSGLVLYLPRRAYQEGLLSPMTFALWSYIYSDYPFWHPAACEPGLSTSAQRTRGPYRTYLIPRGVMVPPWFVRLNGTSKSSSFVAESFISKFCLLNFLLSLSGRLLVSSPRVFIKKPTTE